MTILLLPHKLMITKQYIFCSFGELVLLYQTKNYNIYLN